MDVEDLMAIFRKLDDGGYVDDDGEYVTIDVSFVSKERLAFELDKYVSEDG